MGGSDATSSSVDGKSSTVSPLGSEAVPIVSLLSFNADTLDKKLSQSAVFVSPSAALKSVMVSIPSPQTKSSAPSPPIYVVVSLPELTSVSLPLSPYRVLSPKVASK